MSLALGVLALVLMLIVGWWPMRAFAAHVAGPGLGGRIGTALALGAALTGLAQLVLSLLGVASGFVVPGVLALASVAACVLRVGVGGVAARESGRPDAARSSTDASARAAACDPSRPIGAKRGAGDRLVLGVVLLVALVSAGVGVGLPFKSDGSKFWAPRARELALHPVAEAPSLVDESAMGFHRDYPVLVPLLLAPVFGNSPVDASAGPKLVLQGLAVALVLLTGSLLLRAGAAGRLLLLVFGTLPAWTSLDVRESLVAGGYVDVVVALFLLLLVDAADRMRRGACSTGDVVTACLVAGALVSTKLEGAAELGILLVAWVLAGPKRGMLGWLVGGAALLATPTLVLRGIALASPPIADVSLLADGDALLARSLPLLAGVLGVAFDASVFGLLPLLLVALAWRARAALDGFVPLLVLGMAAFMVIVYLATTMHLGRHLLTSAHRLAFHGMPALCVLVARAARVDDDRRAGAALVASDARPLRETT